MYSIDWFKTIRLRRGNHQILQCGVEIKISTCIQEIDNCLNVLPRMNRRIYFIVY